jgi:hypothetical protein
MFSCENEMITHIEYNDTTVPVGTAISSAEELANIGKTAELPLYGDYYLSVDIDLSSITPWSPIGDVEKPFTGWFNGNGKTISGLVLGGSETVLDVGLFGYAQGAIIENTTVELANKIGEPILLSAASTQTIGALAGCATISTIKKITVTSAEGCGLEIEKSNNGSFNAGGIAGQIKSCTVVYDLHSKIAVIASYTVSIASASTNTAGGVAGIIGLASGYTLHDCSASGAVSLRAESRGIYVGGIAGDISCETVNCISTVSEVTGISNGGAAVGGIAGLVSTYPINGCFLNSGAQITAKGEGGTNTGSVFAGGIVGSTQGGGNEITRCAVTQAGTIIKAESAGSGLVGAGGIAGSAQNISECYIPVAVEVRAKNTNTTTIEYGTSAGGIVGQDATKIENCFSYCDVYLESAHYGYSANSLSTAPFTAAGGIAGNASSTTVITITNCYAKGTVTIENTNNSNIVHAGGIVGYTVNPDDRFNDKLTFSKCAALNSAITVTTANSSDTAAGNRVIGGKGTNVLLSQNIALADMTVTVNNNPVAQTNSATDVSGTAIASLTKTSFTGSGWSFTGDSPWKWDDATNLPLLKWASE